jgi:hypothetical protein
LRRFMWRVRSLLSLRVSSLWLGGVLGRCDADDLGWFRLGFGLMIGHGTITIYRSEARPPMLEEGSESKRRNWFGKRRPL